MFAIAFESLVKLMAFIAVGLFVIYGLYNGIGVGDLWLQAKEAPKLEAYWNEATNWPSTIIGANLRGHDGHLHLALDSFT